MNKDDTTMALDTQLTILQALGDEARLRIMMLLAHGELRVDDLVRTLEKPQSRISRHLAYLKNLGLVKDRRQWNQVFYAIDTHQPLMRDMVLPFLKSFLAGSNTISQDYQRLNELLHAGPQDSANPAEDICIRVLFVCQHNSMRSQMAEAWLNQLGKPLFQAESAGSFPSTIDPLVVRLMKETGLDITLHRTKNCDDLLAAGKRYDYIVTVCDESRDNPCPVFPGEKGRLHWLIPNPLKLEGDQEERMAGIRCISENIRQQALDFIERHHKGALE